MATGIHFLSDSGIKECAKNALFKQAEKPKDLFLYASTHLSIKLLISGISAVAFGCYLMAVQALGLCVPLILLGTYLIYKSNVPAAIKHPMASPPLSAALNWKKMGIGLGLTLGGCLIISSAFK